jgi:hypothetical protein
VMGDTPQRRLEAGLVEDIRVQLEDRGTELADRVDQGRVRTF